MSRFSDKKVLVLIVSFVAAIVFFLCNWYVKREFTYIIEANPNIDQCYDAKVTRDGHMVALDSGHGRIIKMDEDQFVEELISPDGYVDNIVLAPDDTIWTQESYWDGMWVSDEFIVHYVNGKGKEFYHYTYNELSSKHKIYGLSIQGDRVIYCIAESDKIKLITHVSGIITTKYVVYDNAFNAVSDICMKGNEVYILDKSGKVYFSRFANDNDLSLIYSIGAGDHEVSRVPYKLAIDIDDKVYFTDIRNHSIQIIDKENLTSETLIENTDSVSLSIHRGIAHNIYILSESDKLVLYENGTSKKISKLHFNGDSGIYRTTSFITYVLFIVFTIIFVISLMLVAIARLSTTRLLIAITMVLTIIVSGLLMHMLLNNFTDAYKKNIYNQLEISAYVVANRLDPDDISSINSPLDYTTDAYKRINDIMAESYPLNVEFNKNIYCNVLKINYYDEPCAIAYLDQSIGVYYPLDNEEQTEVRTVYDTKKTLWNDAKEDISGTYFYVKAPVFDTNSNVRGCVAVGVPLEVLTEEIKRIRQDMLASSAAILLLLFIVITEVSKILDYKAVYDKDALNGDLSFPGHKFMLLIILVFAAYNMSSTFLPIYIIRRLPNININKELLASLPITINIFIIGVMSLFCSGLIKAFGIKKVLTFTVIFSIIGNTIIFLNPTYFGIFIGLILDGIGVGIITNTCYVIITFLRDEVMKMEGFNIYNSSCLSGINIGMLLGSIIAVNCDYNYVFLFVIGAWAIVMIAASELYKFIKPMIVENHIKNEVNSSKISFSKFVSSSKINLFFILLQNPSIVYNSFVYYFLPIYCDNHGYGTTIVSILFIIYTEIAVLSGGALLKYLTNKFGNNTMYIGLLFNVAAVLIYGFTDSFIGLVVALCLLGFAGGFLKPALQNYFISLKQVDDYGEDNAMGIYNFTENIGESLGPTIFAQVMAKSPAIASILPFSAIISGMGFLHFIVNKFKKEVA